MSDVYDAIQKLKWSMPPGGFKMDIDGIERQGWLKEVLPMPADYITIDRVLAPPKSVEIKLEGKRWKL